MITVDDSREYIVNENEGSIDVTLLLDQPSCRPIVIIASPQERSSPSATGNVDICNVPGSLPLFMCVYVCMYVCTYIYMYMYVYMLYLCMHILYV